jgi:hypothetical protein
MSVVKRSVSVDAALWDELVAAAGGAAVSPLVNDALAGYLHRRRALDALAAFEAEHGAFTAAELAEADRALDAAGVADLTASPKPGPRRRRRAG